MTPWICSVDPVPPDVAWSEGNDARLDLIWREIFAGQRQPMSEKKTCGDCGVEYEPYPSDDAEERERFEKGWPPRNLCLECRSKRIEAGAGHRG